MLSSVGTSLSAWWVDEEVGAGALLEEVVGLGLATVGLGVQLAVVEMPPMGLTLGAGTRFSSFSGTTFLPPEPVEEGAGPLRSAVAVRGPFFEALLEAGAGATLLEVILGGGAATVGIEEGTKVGTAVWVPSFPRWTA